jgi:hypothetical protein
MKKLSLLLFTLGLSVLTVSCGGAGGPTMFSPPIVKAAAFSDASLSGGYSFADSGETLGVGSIKFAEVGVITFDGVGGLKGNATMNDGGAICTATVTGTYSINPDGSGSATVTQAPDAASMARGCTTITFQVALALSGGGAQVQFVETSSTEIASGLALKQ